MIAAFFLFLLRALFPDFFTPAWVLVIVSPQVVWACVGKPFCSAMDSGETAITTPGLLSAGSSAMAGTLAVLR